MLNLTHVHDIVQLFAYTFVKFAQPLSGYVTPQATDLKLNYQNTEFRLIFNRVFALTPLMSAIIISVSVRSAELRLVLYV